MRTIYLTRVTTRAIRRSKGWPSGTTRSLTGRRGSLSQLCTKERLFLTILTQRKDRKFREAESSPFLTSGLVMWLNCQCSKTRHRRRSKPSKDWCTGVKSQTICGARCGSTQLLIRSTSRTKSSSTRLWWHAYWSIVSAPIRIARSSVTFQVCSSQRLVFKSLSSTAVATSLARRSRAQRRSSVRQRLRKRPAIWRWSSSSWTIWKIVQSENASTTWTLQIATRTESCSNLLKETHKSLSTVLLSLTKRVQII